MCLIPILCYERLTLVYCRCPADAHALSLQLHHQCRRPGHEHRPAKQLFSLATPLYGQAPLPLLNMLQHPGGHMIADAGGLQELYQDCPTVDSNQPSPCNWCVFSC
ncbi:hypothetical protein ABBQ32_013304 [Trebouxia sp. C0010 RCD-2024]